MSKRKANGASIKAALARQAERAEAAAQTAAWQPLEVARCGLAAVPDDYIQEGAAKYDDYAKKRDQITKLAAKLSASAAHHTDQTSATDPSNRVAGWQSSAAFCVQQSAMWPGSGVVLQLQQQEILLHILVNHDLHLNPQISSKAYSLLVQNLVEHPPVKLVAGSQEQPPSLECATQNGLCWDIFTRLTNPLLPDASGPFPMLQQLVQNAVQLVTGGYSRSSSSGGGSSARSSSSKKASQGQGLLLLYVVQLMQADLLVRQAAFERYSQLAQSLPAEQQDEARNRAATVLQHSILYRTMQDDSVGGDAWKYIHGSTKGKHQLVRDLLLLVSSTGDEAAEPPTQRAAPAAAAAPESPAAAAAAATPPDDGDIHMDDADMDMLAAAVPAVAAAAAPAPAAKAECEPGVVASEVSPVSAQELIEAARMLLLLLLQLYSSCEEAGVYCRGGEGRHHMQRLQGGAGQPNDRFELDDVMMTAIGSCGHIATHSLLELEQHSRLQRLLLALPPVHRLRLLSLMVADVIYTRVIDPESEGALANQDRNLELKALIDYCRERGRGSAVFRLPSATYTIQAVDVRLDWAAKEMFGGKLLFALLMGTLISAAPATLVNAPGPDKQTFAAAATRVVEHVLQRVRGVMAAEVAKGVPCEALAALAAARQQLALQAT